MLIVIKFRFLIVACVALFSTLSKASEPCQSYQTLSDIDRSVLSTTAANALTFRCDKGLNNDWYRISGGSLSQRIQSSCVTSGRKCLTLSVGWMSGSHPKVSDRIVNRTVCFHYSGHCCYLRTTIQVKNCGTFWVYRLPSTSHFPLCARYCSTKIDFCEFDPCGNHGTCTQTARGYTCTCAADYTGQNCQIAINPCQSNPCRNGFCRARGLNYQCLCKKGYTGRNCDQDIDECNLRISRCPGICINTPGSYQCSCEKGRILLPDGLTCIDPCMSYRDIKDTTRSIKYSGYTLSLCDYEIIKQNFTWYRFNGGKNSQMMLTRQVMMNQCGTNAPGWLVTPHPTVRQGVINGTVCFSLRSNFCRWKNTIQIKNCGSYYVYQLPPPPGCHLRYCSDRYDYCQPNPCFNGNCQTNSTGFYCRCRAGFEGTYCHQEIKECASNPCVKGSCIEGLNGYKCKCLPGITGSHCDADINECWRNNGGCQGTCHNVPHGYYCTCPAGQDLDSNNRTCSDPCANGGIRFRDSLTTRPDYNRLNRIQRYCESVSGLSPNSTNWYQGNVRPNCSALAKWINVTQNSKDNYKIGRLCFHFGLQHCSFEVSTRIRSCSNSISYNLDRLSACYLNYCSKIEGVLDQCINNQCSHGVCIANENGYTCKCNEGYSGRYCQEESSDRCSNNKCLNGLCIASKDGYTCKCKEGYYGNYCELDHCSKNQCENGRCVSVNWGYKCNCTDGYYGGFCQYGVCDTNECENNGTCEPVYGSRYRCRCKSGFYGGHCEYRVCQVNRCLNNGTCEPVGGNYYKCRCKSGFFGSHCEKTICEKNKCQNNGRCEPLQGSYYRCRCPDGFYGKYCDKRVCQVNRCQNNGTCEPRHGSYYSCRCQDGFYGGHCEKEICVPNDCQNKGRCEPLQGASYRCHCQSGFYGIHCENRVCQTNPCKNNGVCQPAGGTSYRCRCQSGFYGSFCDYRVCQTNPCENSGVCEPAGGANYKCRCQSGFYGSHCEYRVCQTKPCKNGGKCVPLQGAYYRCRCQYGFYGGHCENKA